MPKSEIDYSRTIIYKICCLDSSITDAYVGHTTSFVNRKYAHKMACCNVNNSSYNTRVYKFIRNNGGWDNWKMVQIEECSFENSREAEAREHYWIEQIGATLNTNKPYARCKEDPVTYKKEWYEENKEEILEKAKSHYENNRDNKIEYQKQYAKENADKIAEYQALYQEQNKDKIAEQKRGYREQHKEEAKMQQKEWREKNKDKLTRIVECECGATYQSKSMYKHLTSKTHIAYQNALCGIIEEPVVKPQLTEEELQQKKEAQREAQREYRDSNKEKIKNWKKEYNETHKEQIQEYCKSYYEEHKEEIIAKTKAYAEENKETIKERSKTWYQQNKERIKQKQQEMYTCECGSQVRMGGRAEHKRSSKHIRFIELQNANL